MYVVGYAPKTGWAAADIKETLYPNAKLVLINHACPEKNCLLENGDAEDPAFADEMLKMASKADVLFSIGPTIYEYFQNAYRATFDGKQLSDIPHLEILPKLGQVYFESKPVIVKDMKAHSLLTYGQLDSLETVKRCTSMAAAVETVANKECLEKLPEWKIFGISTQDIKCARKILAENIKSGKVLPKLYSTSSAPKLLQSIQQSHLCLPPSCYTDYSFEGLEAMAAGLPITVQEDSHIAAMIERYFDEHEDYCIVAGTPENLAAKITKNLVHNNKAFKKAKRLKKDFSESKAVTESLAKFVSIFKGGEAGTQDSDKQVIQPDIRATEVTKRTEDVQMPVTGDKECEDSMKEMPAVTSVTQDMEVTKTPAVNSGMSVTKDVEITENPESTTMHPWISVREDMETTETMAVAEMSITKDMETTNTKAVHHEMSVTEDLEMTETTAMNFGMSVAKDVEITETTAMNSGMSVADEEITETTAMSSGMSVADVEITETTAMNSGMSVADVEITETTAMNSGMSVAKDVEITETTAMNSGMSVADVEITETTAMNSGMSVADVEITETTAMNSGMSVTKDEEITETTAMNPGMSVTKDVEIAETTESTAVQPEMSITEDREIGETTTIHPVISVSEITETTAVPEMSMAGNRETRRTTAMHFGISVREDMETTETKEMHHGKVRHKKSKTSRNIKQTETLENKETATQTKDISQRKRKPIQESDKTINPKMARGEKIRGGQCKQSKQEQTEINKKGHIKIKQTKQQTQRTKKISSSERKQQPVDSTTARDNTYSNAFTVHVGLTEKFYQQQMRDLDRQVQTRSIRKRKEQLKAAWEKIKAERTKLNVRL
ncbi:uro-adherence factor A-like [Ptychodera flava]|uniref:uro-adherence factor A-like n=1 Tax=Ptychodera flava TaxID=63121 RepID=UPI00396A6866